MKNELIISRRFFYGKAKFGWYFQNRKNGEIIARGTKFHESWEKCMASFFNFIQKTFDQYPIFLDGTGYIQGGKKMKIIQLQSIKTEFTELDDLFIIKKRLEELKAGYEESKLKEAPIWVADKLEDVSLEIDLRATGIIKKKLMAAKSRQSALKPKSVKLEEATKEIEELEKLLKE